MNDTTIRLSGNHKERLLALKQSKLEFKYLDVSSISRVIIEDGLQRLESKAKKLKRGNDA